MLQITKNTVLSFIQENNLDYKFYRNAVQINSFLKTWTNPDTTYRCGIVIEDEDKSKIGVWNDWVAGESGNFIKLIKEFYKCNYYEAKDTIKKLDKNIVEISVPKNNYRSFKTVFPEGNSVLLKNEELKHLLKRGMPIDDVVRNNVYIAEDNEGFLNKYNGKTIFPYFEKGVQKYFISYDRKAKIKYDKATGSSSEWLYNIDGCSKKQLVIVEGVFDVFSCSGVALGTQKMSDVQCQKIVNINPDKIVIAMDLLNSDRTKSTMYYETVATIAEKLKKAGIEANKIFMLNQKKCDFKDFGELNKKQAKEVLENNIKPYRKLSF